jgi:hypothetical protein
MFMAGGAYDPENMTSNDWKDAIDLAMSGFGDKQEGR